jgi:hypothetical protein
MSAAEVGDPASPATAISANPLRETPASFPAVGFVMCHSVLQKDSCSSQRRIKINYHRQSGVTGPLVTESFKSRACNTRTGVMPGDPTEARIHAENSMKLAETASSPTLQKTFLDLAKRWTTLANELDDAYALLKALNELDQKTASEPDLSSFDDGDLSGRQQAPR